MKKFYFISGMPRSGSTLLANILAQNTNFHATSTSGCLDVLFSIRNNWDKLIEHKANPNYKALERVLKATLNAYYEDVDKPIIFDKSRGWLAHLEMIEQILGYSPKILVPIRPLPNILASFEKIHREASKARQPIGESENYFQFQTIEGRCKYWMAPGSVVGLANNRIHDAINRGHKSKLHIVNYNELTNNPVKKLTEIYQFLNEPLFDHDFNNIKQVTYENDAVYGYSNLHKIQPKIQPLRNDAVEILGLELVKKYS